MKKYLSRILCLLMALALVFSLAACAAKNDKEEEEEEKTTQEGEKEEKEEEKEEETPAPAPSVAGKYLLLEMTQNGTTMGREVLVQAYQVQGMDLDSIFSIELKDDGTGLFCANGENQEFLYEDGKLWFEGDPRQKIPYTLENSKLTFELNGIKMVFQTGPITSEPEITPADTNIVGPYTFHSGSDGTTTYSRALLEIAATTEGYSSIDEAMMIELKADGTGSISFMGEEAAILWNETTISNADDSSKSFTYTFQDGYLTLHKENDSLVFVRK